ncbi:MAG TPA: type 4b pilus protein PilO2 [Duganella sp.]|uniref:type 4b pilus protein PilO2 n=1 Tax=Duganella sp. TaxID=1904440 RepID=UPI002ED53578
MAIYVTKIEQYKFVCGLFWQSLSRPRELKKEAIDLGRKIDSDLMVIRMDHSTAQAGFAQTREGARRAMFSLAAIVSKTLVIEGAFYDGEQQPVHNWLGAFALPDGNWLYLAVRNANFLPNGDFAGSKEEVLERLQSDYALGGWNVVIGDPELAELGFHNFNARTIGTLIPRKKDGTIRPHKWWGLYQIDGLPAWLPAALGVAGVALVATVALFGWRYEQRKKSDAENERAMAVARENILRQASAAAHPWSKSPSPTALVSACQGRFDHITAGGWQLESYTCTPDQQSYAWVRGNSTIALLRAQVPAAVIDNSGDKASYARPIRLAPGRNDELRGAQQTLEPLMSHLQSLGLPFKIVPVEAPKSDGGGQRWQPDWKSFLFSLNARGVAPGDIATILNRPGIRVEKLVYRGAEWSMEGTIYAK